MAIDGAVVKLVQATLRTFYEAKYIILMDQLVRKEAMRDEELAGRVGLHTKDVAKIANKLAQDGFLATHRRAELRPGAMKATARTWYYIDYQHTIDNIKWRMFKIRKVIDDKLRNELDSQGYVCPRCKKVFTTLDAGALIDFYTNTMRCDVCETEVVDNENIDEVKRSKDQMNRLLDQTKPIVEGLKKTESIPLQAFNIAAWLEKHAPLANTELPTASGSGPAKVTIELVEGDNAEARRKKEEEAQNKRTQNALPAWIERSTITGDLTAAGAAQAGRASGAGIEIVEDGPSSPRKAGQNAEDDVDSYYAALAAAQAASATVKRESEDRGISIQAGSPVSSGVPANSKLVDSGYEEFNDGTASPASVAAPPLSPAEFGRNGSFLNGLRPASAASFATSLGKRSRQNSEDGDSESGKNARPRTVANSPARQSPPPVLEEADDEGAEGDDERDPICTVGGKEHRFSEITEDMTAEMTPDEYEAYFEVMSTIK